MSAMHSISDIGVTLIQPKPQDPEPNIDLVKP